jgi:hypothetical protein
MAIYPYLLTATILLGASVGRTTEAPVPVGNDLLTGGHEALAGVERLSIVLDLEAMPEDAKGIDPAKLRTQITSKLQAADIESVEGDAAGHPRLVVQIEGVMVPECGKCVCCVQTSVSRTVLLPDRPDVRIDADVWRVRPVMQTADAGDAGEVVARAVLSQVDRLINACQAARRQPRSGTSGSNAPEPERPNQTTPTPQNLQTAFPHPFVASRSSSVYHRPDCRWAQNISEENRVWYNTREEAEQAGKRPCKTCNP